MTNNVGDTATSAGLHWLNDNCIGSPNEMEATAVFPSVQFNAGELSTTMTEEEFLGYRASSANSQPSEIQEKISTRSPSCNVQSPESSSPLPSTRPSLSPPPSLPKLCSAIGPNEALYRQNYKELISDKIKVFKTEHNLFDYRSMTNDQRAIEQQRVHDLLERLRRDGCRDLEQSWVPDSPVVTHVSRRSDFAPSSDEDSTSSEETTDPVDTNQSLVLLSPTQPMATGPPESNRDNISDGESIENVRGSQYHSPIDVDRSEKKRLASSSGRRGADTSRIRRESDSQLAHSIGRLTLRDDHIFTSSQSPIVAMNSSPIRSSSDEEDIPDPMSTQPDVSFGSDTFQSKKYDNDSLVETAMLPDKKVRWDFDGQHTKEAPTDVRLRQGTTFHLPTVPTSGRSFPDPFRFYPDRLQQRLNRLCRWLGNHSDRALVMSMHLQHVIDITMKQLLNHSISEGSGNHQEGKILVVARAKEDLEVWSQMFREGSGLSVFNHATMPPKERKSLAGATLASQYDLVLTTYDALKSPDVVTTLNEQNHAKIAAKETVGHWCSASQAQPGATNKRLSFLHHLRWQKIIFTDAVGKKSFLSKVGTARQQAAVAAQSNSRIIYFLMDQQGKSNGIKALKRSDKRALESVIEVLHIMDELPKEKLRKCIVDFREKVIT